MSRDKPRVGLPSDRFGLGLLAVLLAVATLVALRATRREGPSPGWTEIRADDPRVAGVFLTLHDRGLAAALDSLERQAAGDSLVLRAGHQLSHALGRQAFASSGGSDTVIARCSPAFGSGCYHGVVEASLAGRRTVDMVALERMCSRSDDSSHSGSFFECVHGVGHGVFGAAGGDVGQALSDCDALSSDALQGSCHEGVFMEAFNAAVAGGQRPAGHDHVGAHASTHFTVDPDDPYSPCRGYQGAYGEACWLFQGFLILRRVHFDAGEALRTCDRAPEDWVARCYQSVGHQLTGLFQRDDQWVIERCEAGRPGLQAKCGAGAVLARIADDWTGKRARTFCGEVPPTWREDCRSAYERRMEALRSGSQRG
jgi:hypothetical protein